MFNSIWEANKIGLINFWYYDEQEFMFEEGRLLLRGANGSGKSVTMQSFIPLLLDGNRSPDRLDPFGSRDRRLDNYVLEDDDDEDERTAYLYMEFKRRETDVYATIGMGMRARKRQPLQTWYFFADGGLRVGEKLHLSKPDREVGRVCLTKNELKSAIGTDGQVFDAQGEYKMAVNRLLFGYDDPDDYGEMLNLLISLRSPKLSKEFRPSVISEILNASLPPITEDELRPMSEAIENMDNQKDKLTAMEDSRKAADKILTAFGRYNRMILGEKLQYCLDGRKKLRSLENEMKAFEKEYAELKEVCVTSSNSIEIYETEQEKHQKMHDDMLRENQDAILMQKQLDACLSDLADQQTLCGKKRTDAAAKRQGIIKAEFLLKAERNKAELIKDGLDTLMAEMSEHADDAEFAEHELFNGEFNKQINSAFDFSFTGNTTKKYMDALENGLALLRWQDEKSKSYDELVKRCDLLGLDRTKAENDLNLAENQLVELKQELIEKIYKWVEGNTVFKAGRATLEKISGLINGFKHTDHSIQPKREAEREYFEIAQRISGELAGAEARHERQRELLSEAEAGLKDLENAKEMAPERTPETEASRRRLDDLGIPYAPLYKLVRFRGGVSDETVNFVEEALLNMGLLDALVIPERYREEVMKNIPGLCDKYLFGGQTAVDSIASLIEAEPDFDTFSGQLSDIMNSIGVGNGSGTGHSTSISADGSYEIGIIRGRTSGGYVARYIGEQSRERNRRVHMERLRQEISRLEAAIEGIRSEIEGIKGRIKRLAAEYDSFPDTGDLLTAAGLVREYTENLARIRREISEQESKKSVLAEELRAIVQKIHSECREIRVTANIEAYRQALDAMHEYSGALTNLRIEHNNYITTLQRASIQAEKVALLEAGYDDLTADLLRIERGIRSLEADRLRIEEQLKLSGYEEIKEAMENCLKRLRELPNSIREVQAAKVQAETLMGERKAHMTETGERITKQREICALLSKTAEDELKLGYTGAEISNINEDGGIAGALRYLEMQPNPYPAKDLNDMTSEVQTQINKNLMYLTDYNIQMEEVFANSSLVPMLRIRRINISCKAEGRRLGIIELSQMLATEIEAQRMMIRDSDRKLFEEILGDTVAQSIAAKIYRCEGWVNKINRLMGNMNTSSGLALSLVWQHKKAETEEQLNTKELVSLLKMDAALRSDDDFDKITAHFNSKIAEARKRLDEKDNTKSLHGIIKEILDYRQWFDFQLKYIKTGEKEKELTNKAFYQFSGGEKAMAMYVPLFSAVAAKYDSARADAPRIISLDEAFAGVDDRNITDMFRLTTEFGFNYIINSQVLWGDYETVPRLSIYQLHRPNNVKFVTVIRYIWNGHQKVVVMNDGQGGELKKEGA